MRRLKGRSRSALIAMTSLAALDIHWIVRARSTRQSVFPKPRDHGVGPLPAFASAVVPDISAPASAAAP